MIRLNYNKYRDALVPAIIQHARTGKVLMLGFMNEEAVEITRKTGSVTFFSRSRQRLWTKGETSGNFLKVKKIITDCDSDTLLIKVYPEGPICHTGSESCFTGDDLDFNLQYLEQIIESRRHTNADNSYTSSLFRKGIPAIAQKVGEEATELVIESMRDDREKFLNEAADLLFHLLVLLKSKETALNDVVDILAKRHQK